MLHFVGIFNKDLTNRNTSAKSLCIFLSLHNTKSCFFFKFMIVQVKRILAGSQIANDTVDVVVTKATYVNNIILRDSE